MMEIKDVINFVQRFHDDQKYGDMPYIVHLILVARHFTSKEYVTVALLHDIVEDTAITSETIHILFGNTVGKAVDAITRGDEKEDYLKEYIPRVATNSIARGVKIADLQENIHSAENLYPEYGSLLPKYKKALEFLLNYT